MKTESLVRIAPELSPIITEERLAANVLGYEVMQLDLSSREERQVHDIRNRLLAMPLVHTTSEAHIASILANGIHPYHEASKLPDTPQGATFALDRSLGLDRYVFARWGSVDAGTYGYHNIRLSGRLLLANTIVTPGDLVSLGLSSAESSAFRNTTYSELAADTKQILDDQYFDTMVTGERWLEIIARRVLLHTKKHPSWPYASQGVYGERMWPNEYDGLGEIKYHGTIDAAAIEGEPLVLPSDHLEARLAKADWQRQMWRHGVSVGDTLASLRSTARQYKRPPVWQPDMAGYESFQSASWQHITETDL